MTIVRRAVGAVVAAIVAARFVLLPALASGADRDTSISPILDAIAADALATKKAAGFSFAVVRDGEIVYAKGFGFADVTRHEAVVPQTRFAIGSITKQFTAASILLLAQRGVLTLDDPLANFLPTFPNARAITLRMLLDQTSGLHNSPNLMEHDWPISGEIDVRDLVAILATDPPDFAPGTQWAYSNTNYMLLGAVIAAASGSSETTFLDRNIFPNAGMRMSGLGYAFASQTTVATPYAGEGAALAPVPPVSLDLFGGAGGMVATAPDLAAWDIALMNGALLDAVRMHDFWTPGALADGTPVRYAMGFVPTTLDGHRELWHNGLSPGAGGYCYNAIFPDDKLAIIVLSNGHDFTDVPERMILRVLSAYDRH